MSQRKKLHITLDRVRKKIEECGSAFRPVGAFSQVLVCGKGSLVWVDAVSGNFDLANPTE